MMHFLLNKSLKDGCVRSEEEMKIMPLEGPSTQPVSSNPSTIVIFMHGYGANGDDLISIADIWKKKLQNTLFLSPHAPFPCDGVPFGRQWFSLGNWDPHHYGKNEVAENLIQGVTKALPHINAYMDAVLETYRLTESSVALVGFSQGAMMAISTALSRERACAGVIGYSGGFVGSHTLPIRSVCPTLLIHGTHDGVIPFRAMHESADTLKLNHIPVETLACENIGHGISDEGLSAGLTFLQQQFNKI